MIEEAFVEECAKLGLAISEDVLKSFSLFEEDLYVQNETRNLTRVSKDECWIRHFIDSMLASPTISSGVSVLDIGSGPGFPAWPLAAARPDLRVTALDSSGKMLDFLRRHPLPNLDLIQDRAESWGVREAFDVATGRALAPLSIQLELSAAPLKLGGLAIPMRTPADLAEIERLASSKLGLMLLDVVERELPILGAKRLFPIYEKVARTPHGFPRKWAELRSNPL